MNRTWKALSTGGLAVVLASSTFVPVGAVSLTTEQKNQTLEIAQMIFVKDGKNISLTSEEYFEAFAATILTWEGLLYISSSDGNVYSIDDYFEAFSATRDIHRAFELLSRNNNQIDLEIVEGEIVNRELVPKENTTKENETKRYLAS